MSEHPNGAASTVGLWSVVLAFVVYAAVFVLLKSGYVQFLITLQTDIQGSLPRDGST